MKRLPVFLLTILLCMTLLLSSCGGAGSVPASSASASGLPSKITVGLMTGFQPYCYLNDDGTADGYDVAVITEGAKRLGVEIDFLVVPWESLLTSLNAEKCQVVSSQLWRTKERLEQYDMCTVPYFECGGRLLVKSDVNDLTSLETLNGREIGTTVGDAWTTFLEDYNKENGDVLKLKYYSEDITTIIQDVSAGRVAATLNEPGVMQAKVAALGLENDVKLAGDLVGSGSCYLAFQKTDNGKALRDAFDKVYLEMINDGTMKRLSEEWFGNDYTTNLLDNVATD